MIISFVIIILGFCGQEVSWLNHTVKLWRISRDGYMYQLVPGGAIQNGDVLECYTITKIITVTLFERS